MNYKNLILYYISGTGNSYRISEFIKKLSSEKSWKPDEDDYLPPAEYRKVEYTEYLEASIPTVRELLGGEDQREKKK